MNALATWVAPRIQALDLSHGNLRLSVSCHRRSWVRLVVASSKSPKQQPSTGSSRHGRKNNKDRKLVVSEPAKKWKQQPVVEDEDDEDYEEEDEEEEYEEDEEEDEEAGFSSLVPSPPAGFIVNDAGQVVLVAPADKRVVKLTDPETGRSLDCLIRRAFLSSNGAHCLLLMPLDTPVQILKFEEKNGGGLRELSDEELEEIIPSAEYALARKKLHFVFSGYCLTARGCFCYTDDELMDLETDYGNGSVTEGVEITTFEMGDDEFVIYTPSEPILFVVRKDETSGELVVAEDDLIEDSAVVSAMEEEKEFQQSVE